MFVLNRFAQSIAGARLGADSPLARGVLQALQGVPDSLIVTVARLDHNQILVGVNHGLISVSPEDVNNWRVLVKATFDGPLGYNADAAVCFEEVGRESHDLARLESLGLVPFDLSSSPLR